MGQEVRKADQTIQAGPRVAVMHTRFMPKMVNKRWKYQTYCGEIVNKDETFDYAEYTTCVKCIKAYIEELELTKVKLHKKIIQLESL